MDLATATNIAEIIASLGVVISLVFIAREFRHNAERSSVESVTKAIQSQVFQFAHLTDEPEKADLLRRTLVDFDGLDQGQKGQISTIIHEINLSHNVIRHAYQSGLLSDGEFKAIQGNWLSLMRTTGGRQWWQGWKHMMPDDFAEYVDSVMDDSNLKIRPLNEEIPWLFALESPGLQPQSGEEVKQ